MEDVPQITLDESEFQTGHYSSLLHALGVAMTHCVVWRYADTEEKYDLLQLYHFAEGFEKEHPIKDRSFYMVSAEGAIGVSPGLEYLTKWLFIPAMDEASIAKLQADIRQVEEELKREAEEKARQEAEEKARKEAEEKARQEAEEKARQEAEEKARQEAEEKARKEAEEPKLPNFCRKCGNPYRNLTDNFCVKCGTPRK